VTRVSLDLHDLAKYPFLKESQAFVAEYADSLEDFLRTHSGRIALNHAVSRVNAALNLKTDEKPEIPDNHPTDRFGVKLAVAGYALARVLVSCIRDRVMIDRLCRYEAQRAFEFILDEDPAKKAYIAESVGMPLKSEIPLVTYIELVSGMREDRWRLVNRVLLSGNVQVRAEEGDELLRERIRFILHRQLPLAIPESICTEIDPATSRITVAYQQHMLEQFGTVDEGSFPPCMQALIAALTAGTNITHSGRFSLTAFLHNIGMEGTQIVELFCRAPDFDVAKTLYQVEHISGRGGTEYTAPACAAMRTTGLCIRRDRTCEQVSHPLSYYKFKKRAAARKGKPEPGEKPQGNT
jgi:DNA primase large subunit